MSGRLEPGTPVEFSGRGEIASDGSLAFRWRTSLEPGYDTGILLPVGALAYLNVRPVEDSGATERPATTTSWLREFAAVLDAHGLPMGTLTADQYQCALQFGSLQSDEHRERVEAVLAWAGVFDVEPEPDTFGVRVVVEIAGRPLKVWASLASLDAREHGQRLLEEARRAAA